MRFSPIKQVGARVHERFHFPRLACRRNFNFDPVEGYDGGAMRQDTSRRGAKSPSGPFAAAVNLVRFVSFPRQNFQTSTSSVVRRVENAETWDEANAFRVSRLPRIPGRLF